MTILNPLLVIGNLLNLVATFPFIRALVKDRNILKGYSLSGSTVTMIAMFLFDVWYLLNLGQPFYLLSFIISLPTDAFWTLATAFIVKIHLKERKRTLEFKRENEIYA